MFNRKEIFLFVFLFSFSCQYKPKDASVKCTSEDTAKVSSDVALISSEKYYELKIDSIFPVSQRRIPIKIINHTDHNIEIRRDDYKLEFYNVTSQTWENALPADHAYLMIADIVSPHNTLDLTIYEYTGKAGKYRVIKKVTFTDFSNRSYDKALMGEFFLK